VGFEPLSRIQVQLPDGFAQPSGMSSTGAAEQQGQQPGPGRQVKAIQGVQPVQFVVDGVSQLQWRAFLQQLPHGHWVTVVRGPPEAAVDAFGVRSRCCDAILCLV